MAEHNAVLEVHELDVYYGQAHVLQQVSLTVDHGVLAVVGRNGMGKTTLCNTITGLVPARAGRVRLAGRDILGLTADRIVHAGVGYVPQGRRIFPSLSVDEHLRLAARTGRKGAWTVERIYDTFPRLAERKGNGGAQLSGGEQQMLAIGRALLANPRLLVMDEPTEGLAPVIVDQVVELLHQLAQDPDLAVLLVEQNLGVATNVADTVAVMVNGRIVRTLPSGELAADTQLQQRLLGMRRDTGEEEETTVPVEETGAAPRVFRVRRADPADEAPPVVDTRLPPGQTPTRWRQQAAAMPAPDVPAGSASPPREAAPVFELPVAFTAGSAAYIAGTFDTKGRDLLYLKTCLDRLGVRTVTVDLSTSGRPSSAQVSPAEVARCHPGGAAAVFSNDRGASVAAMAQAFARFVTTRRDLGGLISAGGSGGTALATPAMRALPIGVPKVMVSTVASGNTRDYVGPSDICMMYSVTDVAGINRISARVLGNAAHALAGMIANAGRIRIESKPAIGLTMFGVTTPCVQAVTRLLDARYDCLVFHATGTGGQSMEKLVDSGLLEGVIDATTTEIADLLMGGVFSAGETRLDAVIRSRLPYVGSVGALDMVNFGALATVPERYRGRNLYEHNPQVTLMRTLPEENRRMGEWLAEKLNRMEGPVRFLIPEGGVSMLDAPGQAFHDPEADKALFTAIERGFKPGPRRRLVRLPLHVNDPDFAQALVDHFLELTAQSAGAARG